MKKIALLGALALGFGFTSCDGYDEPNAPAQSNPQEPVFSISGINVENAATSTLDLAAANANDEVIPVLNVTLADFPATSELQMVMEISATEDFAKAGTVPTTYADGVLSVTPDALDGIFKSVISKGPKEKTVYVRYAPYAVDGKETVRIGNPDLFFGPYAVNILPLPSSFVIEDNYYILGTVNGWSVADALPFTHSDLNVYDDPIFTISLNITQDEADAGWWWKIVPQSTYVTGNWVDGDNTSFGVADNGDDALAGMLVGRTAAEDCGAGCITVPGQYLITINMEEMTYEFAEAVPNFWTPGNSNGWNHDNSQLLFTDNYSDYYGYVHLNGDFKFTSEPNWSAYYNLGAGASNDELVNGSNTNLQAPADALYWVYLNLPGLTYSLTEITTIGVIGNATPGGWDASTALTPSADFLTWTGDITFGAGEFKFRANDAWDVNLGGDLTNLVQNGSNLATPGEGTYTVTLELGQLPYVATLVKK